MSNVYMSMAQSKMLYGTEVSGPYLKANTSLEDTQSSLAKSMNNISCETPNSAVLPLLGWLSVGSFIYGNQLTLLWSILSLPTDHIYKRVAIIYII